MCVAYFFFSFFFSFLYKRIFIAFIFFFLLETEQGTQAHTDSDGGRSPQREEAARMPDPGARHEARSGGPGMGAHEGSRTGTTRDKARHGEGEAALGAPPGVLSTPWHVVGTRRHTGDTMTCLSMTRDGPEPREGCEPPEHPRLPPSKVSGLVSSSGPSAPPAGPLLPAPGPAVPPCWVSSRSRSPAVPELLLVMGEGKKHPNPGENTIIRTPPPRGHRTRSLSLVKEHPVPSVPPAWDFKGSCTGPEPCCRAGEGSRRCSPRL